MAKSKRILWMDLANIICTLAVILMHCNGAVHSYSASRLWTTSLVVDCVFYFAVPVFLMLSGANLIGYRKKYDTKTFFKKRFTKVLIPSLFWITTTLLLRIFIFKTIAPPKNFTDLLNYIFTNKAEPIFYFVWEILGVYLIIPLISHFADKKFHKTLWYIVGTFFILNAFIPNILKLFGINWNTAFGIPLGGYVIYAILGYLLNNTEINKKKILILISLTIGGLIFRFLSTYLASTEAGTIIKTTWGYTQWYAYIQAATVFLIIKNLNLKKLESKEKFCNIIAKISGCSFGIYLIHKLIMTTITLYIPIINTQNWAFRTFGAVGIYLISLCIILILKKIPFIKKFVA